MIFFTSDEHYFHSNIIKPEYCNRPFANVEEMNAELIRRHNELVKPGDEVFHLGDFTFNKNRVKEILSQLNGKHHLIMGNHDACHPIHCKTREKKDRLQRFYFDAGFGIVTNYLQVHILPRPQGDNVDLYHLPFAGYENDRYGNIRLEDKGQWLIHGHVHQHWKIKGKQINVGVDVWDFYPVPITELQKIMLTSDEA